jgi:hypothetical protein
MHRVVDVVIEDCGKAGFHSRGQPMVLHFQLLYCRGTSCKRYFLMAVALGHDAIVERSTRVPALFLVNLKSLR